MILNVDKGRISNHESLQSWDLQFSYTDFREGITFITIAEMTGIGEATIITLLMKYAK